VTTRARVSWACANSETTQLFGKLLRLALVSDQDGEVLSALAALKRALAASGLDPHHIVDCYEYGTKSLAVTSADREHGDDRSAIWFAFHRRYSLTPRDRDFVEAMTRWRGLLSVKQQKWLRDIIGKLESEAA
jgi:hypothetical protein